MRIHSDFRDYYDIGLSVGVDTSLHYDRKERYCYAEDIKTPFPPDTLSMVRLTRNVRPERDIERVLIGFCGTLYPCIRLVTSEKESVNIYSPEHLEKYFPFRGVPSWGRPSDNWAKNHRQAQRKRAAFLGNRPQAEAMFVELNAPVFVVQVDRDDKNHEIEIITNAPLKPFEFAKVFDPFTAFQEISMYLGNQLVPRENPQDVPDKYRIAQHGYDKQSFRHPVRVRHLA